jgi:hypothetical protein
MSHQKNPNHPIPFQYFFLDKNEGEEEEKGMKCFVHKVSNHPYAIETREILFGKLIPSHQCIAPKF